MMHCFRLGLVPSIQPKHTKPLREGPAEGLLLARNHANTWCPVNRLTPAHKHNIIRQHARVERLREQLHYIAPDTQSVPLILVVMQKSCFWGSLTSTSGICSFEAMSRNTNKPGFRPVDAHPAEGRGISLTSSCLYFLKNESHGSILCFIFKLCKNYTESYSWGTFASLISAYSGLFQVLLTLGQAQLHREVTPWPKLLTRFSQLALAGLDQPSALRSWEHS